MHAEESAIAITTDEALSSTTAPSARRPAHSGLRPPRPAVRWLVAGLVLWLLIGPRIELPGSLNLRVEDAVFGALAVICLLHLRGAGRPAPATVAVLGVAITGLISAAAASAREMVNPVSAVLFALRPVEYWIVFPAVLLLLRAPHERWRRRLDALLTVVTVLQTAFAVLQYYFAIPIGFSHAAYTRAAGLTVGPYELGAISAMLLVYWIARGRWTMASLSVVALAASISRISILGAGIAVAVLATGWVVVTARRARRIGWRSAIALPGRPPLVLVGQALSVAAAGLVLAFTVGLIHLPAVAAPPAEQTGQNPPVSAPTDEPVPTEEPTQPESQAGPQAPSSTITQRLESTSVLGSWQAADELAARVPHPNDSVEYQFAAYAGLNIYVNANTAADAGLESSNLIRFFRWHLILDTIDDPADVVFGLGPSFIGPSVDGSYLRFLADGGVLGVLAWLVLIVTWLRRSPFWMICVTLSLLIGAVFIDILYAQRPMVLFWVLLALATATTRRRSAPVAEVTA